MSEANVSKFFSRADRERKKQNWRKDREISELAKFAEWVVGELVGAGGPLYQAPDSLHENREMQCDCQCYWDTRKRLVMALQEILPRIVRYADDPMWQDREGIEPGTVDWLGFKIHDPGGDQC